MKIKFNSESFNLVSTRTIPAGRTQFIFFYLYTSSNNVHVAIIHRSKSQTSEHNIKISHQNFSVLVIKSRIFTLFPLHKQWMHPLDYRHQESFLR